MAAMSAMAAMMLIKFKYMSLLISTMALTSMQSFLGFHHLISQHSYNGFFVKARPFRPI